MRHFKNLVRPYLVWSFLIIVIPLFLIFMYAVTTNGNSLINIQFTLDNFKRFFSDETFPKVVSRSLWIAVLTTVVCFLLGYPMAYFISKTNGKRKGLLVMLVTIPMWINMLVRTYALMGILSDNGLLNSILGVLGLPPVQIMYTDMAVMLGMVYDFLPFMVLQVYGSLEKMDASLLEAAADLGADGVKTFLKVVFPLSIPGVLSGITLVFLPAVSSFFIPKLLGGGQYFLVGNLIENQFITVGEWNFGSAISMIMAIIMMLMMMAVRKVEIHNQGGKEE